MSAISNDRIQAAFDWLLTAEYHAELRSRLAFGRSEDALSDYERLAIWTYTTEGGLHFHVYNAESPRIEHVVVLRSLLRMAALKLRTYRGFVYRGLNIGKDHDAFVARYQTGTTVIWDNFSSSSTDPNKAFRGNVHFRIRCRCGRLLGAYSSAPWEQEVLLLPEIRLLVRNTIYLPASSSVLVVDLEET
jgi:NAD:arginine ADP-ribosyltransferase